MTVNVANTNINNTWEFWRNRTNQMADVISRQAVTVNSNSAVGDAGIIGSLRANTLYSDIISGGNIGVPSILTITTELKVSNNVFIENNLTISQNTTSNNVSVTNKLSANTIKVGNTSINRANVYSDEFYGVWKGEIISIDKGGTGLSDKPTIGQLLIGTSSNTYILSSLTEGIGIDIDSGDGSIVVKNSGLIRFQANSSSPWRSGDITLSGSDIINALGFVPAAGTTAYWQRVGADLNYFSGNVSIGYTDSSSRSNGTLMVISTTSNPSNAIILGENGNTSSSNATSYLALSVANNSALSGISFRKKNVEVGAIDYYTGSDLLSFSTAGTEKVYIDSTGNIGMGIPTPQPNNGGNGLHIKGSNPGVTIDDALGNKWNIGQNPNSIVFSNGLRSNGQFAIWSDQSQSGILFDGNTSSSGVSVIAGGSGKLYVQPNGKIRIGTTDTNGMLNVGGDIFTSGRFESLSDYRLKDEIVPLTNAIKRIKALRPVIFRFKENGRKEEGFLAHEVQEIIPTAVQGTKDGVVSQTLDKTQMIPITISALQDLIDIVTEQNNEIENLKNRNRI